jgi:hypothetical protein
MSAKRKNWSNEASQSEKIGQKIQALLFHVGQRYSDNPEKNTLTTSSSTWLTVTCHAQGLDITSPLCVEAHAQDLQFHRHQQYT